MKKRILILSILSLSFANCILSQNLTADKIISLSDCTSFTCFNKVVASGGFSYLWTKENKNLTFYVYNSDRKFSADSTPSITTPNTTTFVISDDKKVSACAFRTSEKSLFNSILSDFMKKGFEELNTKPAENGVVTNYYSSSYPELFLSVTTDRLSQEGVGEWTSYNFHIERNH